LATLPKLPEIDAETMANAQDAAQKIADLLQDLRGGDGAFYVTMLKALQIELCEFDNKGDSHKPSDEANRIFLDPETANYLPYYR
jgi:hypothetical protein